MKKTMIERHGPTAIMHRTVQHNGVLHVGGMVADDCSLGKRQQTTQILLKLDGLLGPLGSGKDEVLAGAIYVMDFDPKTKMNAAWTDFSGDHMPIRATIGVADLGKPRYAAWFRSG